MAGLGVTAAKLCFSVRPGRWVRVRLAVFMTVPEAGTISCYPSTATWLAQASNGWRWCEKCRVLFYADAANGACPAGGEHNASGSSIFAMQFDDGSSPTNQQGWRWCKNCQGLFFALNASPGPCPAGAGWVHDPSESGNYNLPFLGVPSIWTYGFDGNLKAGGSNYTLGGQVDVFTKYGDGELFHRERVTAIENPNQLGGSVTAGTNSLSDPAPADYNGYVQAHDLASDKWSPKLPIIISVRIDC
jgi:hypothetical protein